MMKRFWIRTRELSVSLFPVGLAVACLAAISLLPVSCSRPDSATRQHAVPKAHSRVDIDEFAELVKKRDTVLLDVRTPEEFAAGHIPGARNLNVNDPGFRAQIAELDPEITYLVYCRSGRRSQGACQIMGQAGLDRLYELMPGFNGWKSAGMSSEK